MVFQPFRYFMNPKFSAVQTDGVTGDSGSTMASHKSSLRDFLASIATMSGDLSNITAPPFVLDEKSVVEIPSFWAENPAMFVSPAQSEDPAERSLLILKSFLAGMKSQCYMGHTEAEGVKKPLNAFLGELFLGEWDDAAGKTYLVSEQVSHHPPITACRVWNPEHGVIAEGYNKQKVTFSWTSMSVSITSTGFALKSLQKYNEHYLVPLPNFKVKGVLSGAPYPEVDGVCYIPSTNGYMSKIDFGAHGMFSSSKKHGFSAIVYKESEGPKHPIYSIEGNWNTEFTIVDERSGKIIETHDVVKGLQNLPKLHLPELEDMDPWESRRAWHDTQEGIRQNNFGTVSNAKSFLEQGQRSMRKEEERNGTQWQPLFFKSSKSHDVVKQLMTKIPDSHDFETMISGTKGVWLFDEQTYDNTERPFHPGLEPDNLKEGEERVYRNGSRASFQASPASTPRGSVDTRRDSTSSRSSPDRGRASIDLNSVSKSLHKKQKRSLDERFSTVDDGSPNGVNGTRIDIGQEPSTPEIQNISKEKPAPQTHQTRRNAAELGSGVEGLNLKEKTAVEDMLRDKFGSNS